MNQNGIILLYFLQVPQFAHIFMVIHAFLLAFLIIFVIPIWIIWSGFIYPLLYILFQGY